jgi:FG-GAP-like repeat
MRTHRFLSLVSSIVWIAAATPRLGAAAVCTGTQFGPSSAITTGWNPHSIAIGDFNGDGKQDLAVANSFAVQTGGSGSSISILIGNGDGTFQPPVNISAPGAPFGIVAVDLNGDGILDLATADLLAGTVSVLMGGGSGGVGNGTFAPAVHYAAGAGPFNIVAADLDGDGKIDLAVSNNAGGGAVTWLHALGGGVFGSPQTYPLTNIATGLLATDVDGDGRPDLVVCVPYSGTLALLHNNGGGSFAAPSYVAAGVEPFSVVTADWDGDGIRDLVVPNSSNGNVQFLHGLGSGGVPNGSFSPPVSLGGGNTAWASSLDANGDGKLDIVFGQTSSSVPTSLGLLLGDGHGAFASPTWYPVGTIPLMIAVGDFDGSGKPDLAVANYFNDFVSVLLGVCLVDPNLPVITSVRDVPNDQGGKVFVTWTRSAQDVTGGSVTNYRVWRRIPPGLAQTRLRDPATSAAIRAIPRQRSGTEAAEIDYWEALVTLPAQRLAGYGYTAPTTQDSLPSGNPHTAFFVSALTSNIDVFYDSDPDSGYSVDNLPPFPPQGLVALFGSSGISLHWHPNPDGDLAGYQLFRGNTAGFVPQPGNRVASLSDTAYVDPSGDGGSWYKLVATDIHGNASAAALAAVEAPTATTATTLPSQVTPEEVDLSWLVTDRGIPVTVQRSSDGAAWRPLGATTSDGTGLVRWTDRDILAGAEYQYRLQFSENGTASYAGETDVRIPAPELALSGVLPNPLPEGRFVVQFTLADDGPARLEVVDVAGRRIAGADLHGLGAGSHRVDLGQAARIPPGMYVIRLTAGDRTLTRKAVVTR